MNPLVLALLVWLSLGLELALRQVLGVGGVAVGPSVAFAMVAVICAFGPRRGCIWLAMITGLLVDLTAPLSASVPRGPVVVIGPQMLGYAFGAWMVMKSRGFLVRSNPLALMLLAVIGTGAGHIVAVLLLWLRDMSDSGLEVPPQAWARMLGTIYTAGPALLFGLSARWLVRWLGLQDPFARQSGFGRGSY